MMERLLVFASCVFVFAFGAEQPEVEDLAQAVVGGSGGGCELPHPPIAGEMAPDCHADCYDAAGQSWLACEPYQDDMDQCLEECDDSGSSSGNDCELPPPPIAGEMAPDCHADCYDAAGQSWLACEPYQDDMDQCLEECDDSGSSSGNDCELPHPPIAGEMAPDCHADCYDAAGQSWLACEPYQDDMDQCLEECDDSGSSSSGDSGM